MARTRKIKDVASAAITYEGVSSGIALTSESVWQIKRIVTIGSVVLEEYAGEGEFDKIWDNRTSLFGGVPFMNTHSIQFDGVNDRIDVPHHADIDFGRLVPFTISFWVKSPNTATKNYIEKMTSNRGYRIFDAGSNKIQFEFRGASTGDRIRLETSSVTDVNNGNWHHIVVTYSGSGAASGVRMYMDGQQLATTTLNDSLTGTTNNTDVLTFAARSGGGTNFVGNMDEISIWDAALSTPDVVELYNDGYALDLNNHSNGSLKCWWSFNDVNYPTVPDSVSGRDGSMINMTPGDVESEVPHG